MNMKQEKKANGNRSTNMFVGVLLFIVFCARLVFYEFTRDTQLLIWTISNLHNTLDLSSSLLFTIFERLDDNFSLSIRFETREMTSKCLNKWNLGTPASGFTV